MSSRSRFIDDECGVASEDYNSSLEMEDEVEEPAFISERNLEGLKGEDLREATLKLVFQEMNHIMPPACFGSKIYILYLACKFISVAENDPWEALEDFIEVFDVSRRVFFTDLSRELVEGLIKKAIEENGKERDSDKEWEKCLFMELKRQEHQ